MSKSLVEALYERYNDVLNDNSSQHQQSSSSYSASSTSCSPPDENTSNIEFYLAAYSPRKSKSTGEFIASCSLIMSNQQINTIGDEESCTMCCKNVCELDLARNEISSWDEIRKLLQALRHLRLLNLSHNPLVQQHVHNYFQTWPDFTQLKILILNSCYINATTLKCFLDRLSNLNELHLCSNNYSEINFQQDFTKNTLKILYLNNNSFSEWSKLCKIGKCFPNLETLVISDNNLSNFNDTCDELATAKCFKSLEQLIINRLPINEWQSIDQLRKFPSLKHVRIQNIPLLDQYNDDEKYYLLVAHLEGPTSLNGSEITLVEKEKCERAFLRYYIDNEEMRPSMRHKELETRHGELRKLADVKLNATKHVYVKIKYNDKQIYEQIDVRMTVGEFKKYLEKFVGHTATKFRVFYIDLEAFAILGPEELKHLNRCLHSFNVRDGDEFEIDLKHDAFLPSLTKRNTSTLTALSTTRKENTST